MSRCTYESQCHHLRYQQPLYWTRLHGAVSTPPSPTSLRPVCLLHPPFAPSLCIAFTWQNRPQSQSCLAPLGLLPTSPLFDFAFRIRCLLDTRFSLHLPAESERALLFFDICSFALRIHLIPRRPTDFSSLLLTFNPSLVFVSPCVALIPQLLSDDPSLPHGLL